jgi:heat-inducible transcriptional repressor
MLDERKAAILRAVVQEYISTAQPVGSAHLVRDGRVNVSAATVRNEMAALEREGFLAHPHTSAGRVPTDKGYRFFVDDLTANLLRPPERGLAPAKKQQVHEFFTQAHGQLEQMLSDTGRLLSDLTRYAALVTVPGHDKAVVRSVQIVPLGSRLALALAVLSDGTVDKATLELDAEIGSEIGEEKLAAAGMRLDAHLRGSALGGVNPLPPSGDDTVDRLTAAAHRALLESHGSEAAQVFVGGAAHMAVTFDAIDTVRQVLAILEQQYVVVTLLRESLQSGSLSVAIGTEHGVSSLSECSLVVAPYRVEGESVGTVALLGPTRMDYREAMGAVALVSERLGRHLSEG